MDVINVGDLYRVSSWSKSSSGIFKCVKKDNRNGRNYLYGLKVMKHNNVIVDKGGVEYSHDHTASIKLIDSKAIDQIFEEDVMVARKKAMHLHQKMNMGI